MNFAKFLLNEKGEVVKYFDPLESLDLIRQEVEKLLSWFQIKDKITVLNEGTVRKYVNFFQKKHSCLDLCIELEHIFLY